MELVWAILCKLSVIDYERNTISLIEALERVVIRTDTDMTSIPIELELVSSWWRDEISEPETSNARWQIVSPQEDILATFDFDVDLENYPRLRSRGIIHGLPFKGNGIYRFHIELFDEEAKEWQCKASIPLEIVRESDIPKFVD